jgi:hypothetical protein
MNRAYRPARVVFTVLGGLVLLSGCVERTVRVETDPPGALVVVNDQEVGVSPTKFSFTWYGDYDIIVRKPGYKTLKTNYRLREPWYQWPPIDIVAELLIPVTIRDEHVLPTYVLEPAEEPAVDELVERAAALRDEALYQGP